MSAQIGRRDRAMTVAAMALTLLLLLVGASLVAGQIAAPAVPGQPAVPGVPNAPGQPVDPSGAMHQLSLALIGVNAHQRSLDSLTLDVAGSLLELSRGRDVRPLSLALVEGLRGRSLTPNVRDRVATAVVDALGTRQLEQALSEVTAALIAAGLGAPEIVLVETELRRLGRRGR